MINAVKKTYVWSIVTAQITKDSTTLFEGSEVAFQEAQQQPKKGGMGLPEQKGTKRLMYKNVGK